MWKLTQHCWHLYKGWEYWIHRYPRIMLHELIKMKGEKKQTTFEKQGQQIITSKLLRDGHRESSSQSFSGSIPVTPPGQRWQPGTIVDDSSRTEVTSFYFEVTSFVLLCVAVLGKQYRPAVSTKRMGPYLPFRRDGSAKSLEIAGNWRQQGRQKQLLCSDCQLVLIQ